MLYKISLFIFYLILLVLCKTVNNKVLNKDLDYPLTPWNTFTMYINWH